MKQTDYSERDREAAVTFFVPLWKRPGISLALFDDYWRDVHGPVCARLPGQFQYWQFHVEHNTGGYWPADVETIDYRTEEDGQFDGIAELTFRSPADRTIWFQAAAILMDDEQNLFRRAIGYNTSPGNSKTYVDGFALGDRNGGTGGEEVMVMLRPRVDIAIESFQEFVLEQWGPALAANPWVTKVRAHVFDEVDSTRPPAAGVEHAEPPEKSYRGALHLGFADAIARRQFFAAAAYQETLAGQAAHLQGIATFRFRDVYTFVYNGEMTLAGQRGSSVAQRIVEIGAINQLQADVVALMLGRS